MDTELRKRVFSLIAGLAVAFSMIYTAEKMEAVSVMGEAASSETAGYVVVLDAGHGGDDPGKVSSSGVEEKQINLEIAQRVKAYLEAGDVQVVMTRETDAGLYDPAAGNKKSQDMKRRIEIIESSGADVAVSIHQNSYPEEYVHGAQVFYHTSSEKGKYLAGQLQEQLVCLADPENHRQIKADAGYYLLKKSAIPTVIVECGFLSNDAEAAKLTSEEYQNTLAWAIYLGIIRSLNEFSSLYE